MVLFRTSHLESMGIILMKYGVIWGSGFGKRLIVNDLDHDK